MVYSYDRLSVEVYQFALEARIKVMADEVVIPLGYFEMPLEHSMQVVYLLRDGIKLLDAPLWDGEYPYFYPKLVLAFEDAEYEVKNDCGKLRLTRYRYGKLFDSIVLDGFMLEDISSGLEAVYDGASGL